MGEIFFFFRDYYESIYDDTKHKCLFCEHEEAYLSGMDVELAHSQRTSKRLLNFLFFFREVPGFSDFTFAFLAAP